jgi:hypothetical protein
MYQGGIWALKQRGKTVVSTRQSYYKLKGKVEGNQLKGKVYYKSIGARTFAIKISSDGQSFKGTAYIWQGTAHLKGKRKE